MANEVTLGKSTMQQGPEGYSGTREYWVVGTGQYDAMQVLYTQAGVCRGSIYKDDSGAVPDGYSLCINISCEPKVAAPTGGTGLYLLVAHFGHPRMHPIPQAVEDGATRMWFEKSVSQEPADYDAEGNAIKNAAGMPFDPPLTIDVVNRTLCIQWIERATSQTVLDTYYWPYENTLNSATYKGAPPDCLKCLPFDIVEATNIPKLPTDALTAFSVTARVAYKAPRIIKSYTVPAGQQYAGWLTVIADRGFMKRTAGTVEPGDPPVEPIVVKGREVTEPQNLTSDGYGTLAWGSLPNLKVYTLLPHSDFNLWGH